MATSRNSSKDLLAAVKGNDLDRVKKILQTGADPNIYRSQGFIFIPLLEAARYGKVDMIKCLLQFKADVEIEDDGGWTALHWAAYKGHAAIVELLLSHGADVNKKEKNINGGRTVLHYTAFHPFVAYRTRYKNKDKNTSGGWTPLHWACCYGHVTCVRILLEHGADVALRDSDGKTARDRAVERKKSYVVKLLDDFVSAKGLTSMSDSIAVGEDSKQLRVEADNQPPTERSTVDNEQASELKELGEVAESLNPFGCLEANGRVVGSTADLDEEQSDSYPHTSNNPLAVPLDTLFVMTDEIAKQILIANLTYLKGNLRARDIYDYLIQYRVMNQDDIDEIINRRFLNAKGVKRIVSKVYQGGSEKYESFLKVLQASNYEFIAVKLSASDVGGCTTSQEPQDLSVFDCEEEDRFETKLSLLTSGMERMSSNVTEVKKGVTKLKESVTELKESVTALMRSKDENDRLTNILPDFEQRLNHHQSLLNEYFRRQTATNDGEKQTATSSNYQRSSSALDVFKDLWTDVKMTQLMAFVLADDVINYVGVGQRGVTSAPPTNSARTLRRVVDDNLSEYETMLKDVILRVDVPSGRGTGYDMLAGIADEIMNKSSPVTWRCVVDLFAFAGLLAKHLALNSHSEMSDNVRLFIGQYVASHLAEWIDDNGGWDAMEEYFAEDVTISLEVPTENKKSDEQKAGNINGPMNNSYEAVVQERDAAIIRYTQAEQRNMELQEKMQETEKTLEVMNRKKENLIEKIQTLKAERQKWMEERELKDQKRAGNWWRLADGVMAGTAVASVAVLIALVVRHKRST